MGWRGLLAGALGLAALERIVSNRQAAGRLGGLGQSIGTFIARFLDPAIPAFGPPKPKASGGGGGGFSIPTPMPGISIPISARPSSPYGGQVPQLN